MEATMKTIVNGVMCYTRIYQTGPRRGDSAPMAILELVD